MNSSIHSPHVSKILISSFIVYLPQVDFLRLRQISKVVKKIVNNFIKRDTILHCKLGCAKNSTLFDPRFSNVKTLQTLYQICQKLSFEMLSAYYCQTETDKLDKHFKIFDHVLTFENHNFALYYPEFARQDVHRVVIDVVGNQEFEFNLDDCNQETEILQFLWNNHKVSKAEMKDKLDENLFSLDINEKFLEYSYYYTNNDLDEIDCKLFWWYRTFPQMPSSGTKFSQIIVNDDDEIVETFYFQVFENYMEDNKGRKYLRKEWFCQGFDKRPIFIES